MATSKMNFEDISQMIIGSSVLSVPIAFTEEAWKLGESLPGINLVMIISLSLAFLCLYSYQGIFQGNIEGRVTTYFFRIFIDYIVTCSVVAVVLFALNRFPIITDIYIALKRMIIISFPASMGAVVIDSFDKE
jgi:uncharacterized membrane protein